MSRSAATLILALAIPSIASADEIQLRSGGKIVGIAREEKDRVVVETGYGTVAFPSDQVMSITKGQTPLHAWPTRYAEIQKSRDARDFLKLAAWARENDLPKYVGGLMRRAFELDPENAEAREALGFVRHRGRWLTFPELRKEQGLVEHEGRWVLPLEKELAEQRRLEADSRRIEEESARRSREEARKRAREEAELRVRLRAAEAERERETERRTPRRRIPAPTTVYWNDAYEILLVGRLLGFGGLGSPYFPVRWGGCFWGGR
ncbi:MAG TPA: hypothetical protein VK661_05155 [Planctomycetota bacterium]|nr:hypothetical protein [Planctomycetota bacterium]